MGKSNEVVLKSVSKRGSKAIAQSLMDANFSFRYSNVGATATGYFFIQDPSDEQMRFLNRHYRVQMMKAQE